MGIASCKKDDIKLKKIPKLINAEHPTSGFFPALRFEFGDEDDYGVVVDGSKSSPKLNFYEQRVFKNRSGAFETTKLPSFGSKGVIKNKTGIVAVCIDLKSIKIGKEQSFKVGVYKNDKLIDGKIITFVIERYNFVDRHIVNTGHAKKLCISNWLNIMFCTKESFELVLRYPYVGGSPESVALNRKIRATSLRNRYDDCYLEEEDSDSDRY